VLLVNVWYVSFHGGVEKTDCNNIHVYAVDGTDHGKALNRQSLPPQLELRELRGFTFGPDGDLYVLNAHFEFSQVVRFNGQTNKDGLHDFKEIFVAPDTENNPGISHPFNLAFDAAGNLLVASQNTNLVTRYFGPKEPVGQAGKPMPVSDALTDRAVFPGTFVSSTKQSSSGIQSVRDIVFGPDGNLYVADRDAGSVRYYDETTGTFLGEFTVNGGKPVHLMLDRDRNRLYIGDERSEGVWVHEFANSMTRLLVGPEAGRLKNPSGMAMGTDGLLYVASRTERQILRFDQNGQPVDRQPFLQDLPDNPEFIQLVTPLRG
jgi:DNA-binding beta-propeller fold protein YncE